MNLSALRTRAAAGLDPTDACALLDALDAAEQERNAALQALRREQRRRMADIGQRSLFAAVPHNGRPTSQAAARSMAGEINNLRMRVFAFIRDTGEHGATGEEIEHALHGTHQTISARPGEPEKAGLVRDSGRKRLTASGRLAIVWVKI